MTTRNPSITLDRSTDAAFRAWTSAVATALQECHLVKMGDTGQMNFATVLAPTVTNTSRGYEIYQLSRFSDKFTRADGIITVGSQTSTGHAAAVYSATSGGATLPYVVSNQVQAAAAPTTASVATALIDRGSTPGINHQSVDLDIVSTAANASGDKTWDLYLRYTNDSNHIRVRFLYASGGNYVATITQVVAGVSTTLATSGTFGTTDPTHLRAEIDSSGLVKAIFSTGSGGVYTNQTLTVFLSSPNSALLTGTKNGFTIYSTSVADNLCVAEPRAIYLKLEYGSGNTGGAVASALWATLGGSTDGAGSIATLATARRNFFLHADYGSSNNCFFSGDGSYINMVLAPASTQFMMMSIERSRDAAGAVTQDGLMHYLSYQTSSPTLVPADGAVWFANGNVLASYSSPPITSTYPGQFFSTAIVGADTYYFPRVVALPKLVYDLSLMVAYPADVTNFVAVTVPNCGSTHTYLPYIPSTATAATGAMLMRYE